jgi:hypothetical protein
LSNFVDFLLGGQGCPHNFTGISLDKVVLVLGQIVLTKRVGLALRFSEFNKDYITKNCVSVVLVIHLRSFVFPLHIIFSVNFFSDNN